MDTSASKPAPASGYYQSLDLCAPSPYPRSWYPRKAAWMLAYKLLFRPSPRRFMKFRVWLVNRFGGKVDRTCVLRPSCSITHPWLLTMGAYSTLAENVTVYNLGPLTIGPHTVISQNVHLCNGTHNYRDPSLPLVCPTMTIGGGVWVCADAFIGPGVTIGDNSIIAARAVVTKDAPANSILGGNPAKVLRERPAPER
jgi:putative colanic acid biosynthesis acetyltransferase WcaF